MTWASDVVQALAETFGEHRDPARSAPMRAYMQDQFEYFGIPTSPRRALTRAVLASRPRPTPADLAAFASACWERPEREFQYAAVDVLTRAARGLPSRFLGTVEHLITTRSWWDTVDGLARGVAGEMARRHADARDAVRAWIDDPNIWKRRAALLHQGRWKDQTEADVLFEQCLRRAGDPEFWIRKAIGWALRDYSYVDPAAVEAFVTNHAAELSGLSRREAMRAIERRRARPPQ